MAVYKLENSNLVVIAQDIEDLISKETLESSILPEQEPSIELYCKILKFYEAIGNQGNLSYQIYARNYGEDVGRDIPWARYLIDVYTPDGDYVYILVSNDLNDFLKVLSMLEPFESYRKRLADADENND